ncbi:NPR2-domain-containing protein [Rickenella mellea]|uniref:NPR2-domain-containing protein n=1 Tax=Rickenella mellea TaxID=50990 RepID=A0A4Y7QDA6_9AGAM|nr:NPR2-domain-containing protein [Rickenella mellea]
MPAEGDSFLPRIFSVFYAVFEDKQGPKIVYQVPEGLIGSPPSGNVPFSPTTNGANSRASSTSRRSLPLDSRQSRASPQVRSTSLNTVLFNFEDISRYVIPPQSGFGRLVVCATRKHRVMGFPVELDNEERYKRRYFRYNLCFVFDRRADLSCYEPIVRKIGRVLTACEEESCFLSSPETSLTIHSILEQLFEDLNSYSETSIPINEFNSIELKIFPFYPNPPPVHDWAVPVALINLTKRIEPNWDLTMAKVCPFIDGTNHVSRIAHLADCDMDLTRKAISHLLYYQVIMMIDIFQYSNMYTLCKSIQWLADEANVREECGSYVTKPDREVPHWPQLLHLYSRLKQGKSIFEWMQEYDVEDLGVDPRRFTSFGVIKGFLRRVHRWPVFIPEKEKPEKSLSPSRRRGKSLTNSFGTLSPDGLGNKLPRTPDALPSQTRPALVSDNALTSSSRRASAAEVYLEQFRRDLDASNAAGVPFPLTGPSISPRVARFSRPQIIPGSPMQDPTRRNSLQQPYPPTTTTSTTAGAPPPYAGLFSMPESAETRNGAMTPSRPRISRSPSGVTLPVAASPVMYPSELKGLLDGTHHTDELSVRLEAGWPLLEKFLVAVGGGKGNGDYGTVEIIYH